jgi:DNA invertase Pin-like site-specific DNA recombinase
MTSPNSPHDEQRQEAIARANDLMAECASLRADLRAYETAIRQIRRHIQRGRPDSPLNAAPKFVPSRAQLADRIEQLEHRRRLWRRALFTVQQASGMTITDIAREWGLSRQLVSRILARDYSDEARQPTSDNPRART